MQTAERWQPWAGQQGNYMRRILAFKTIVYDTNLIIPKVSSYSFFQPHSSVSEESATIKSEQAMVRWLFSCSILKSLIIGEIAGYDTNIVSAIEVQQPIITEPNNRPGNIDILICNKFRPEQTIAIESKRAKVVVYQNGSQKVNKLKEIEKGIKQANGLQSMGFWKSYLLLLIVIDARLKNGSNVIFKYGQHSETSSVYEVPMNASLNRDVGVAYIEIVQPTGKDINKMALVGICIDKRAQELQQGASLTERVRTYLNDQRS